MNISGDASHTILAGATGLVGNHVLTKLLSFDAIHSVTALVRNPLDMNHPKLVQVQDAQLRITSWNTANTVPDLGFICLGTTIKQAGSRDALAQVDLELVTQVAHTMKLLGVKRVAVVSSYGANKHSWSHYLKCKGKMEQNLLDMGFERLVIVRPGPLDGERQSPRLDETIVKNILMLFNPLLIGPLKNFKPIRADLVASAMIYALIKPSHHPADRYLTYNSSEIVTMLEEYQVPIN